jgi:hypothetical protein
MKPVRIPIPISLAILVSHIQFNYTFVKIGSEAILP